MLVARLRSSASTCCSSSSSILRPPRAKSLIAVVLERVVARRDHHGRRVARPGELRDAGRRQDAGELDVGALGAEPGDERGLEQRTRAPRVATDDEGDVGPEHPRRGATERRDELGGQIAVRDTADAVGAEAQGHAWARAMGPR